MNDCMVARQITVSLAVEEVRRQGSHGSQVGRRHRALAHACERAAARHAIV